MKFSPLLLLLVIIYVDHAYSGPCAPNACWTVRCGVSSCQAGYKYMDHGGYCGCCTACYQILRKYSFIFNLQIRQIDKSRKLFIFLNISVFLYSQIKTDGMKM